MDTPSSSISLVFASWDSFKLWWRSRLIGKQPFQRGRFLFRGHGREDWPLRSYFDRRFQSPAGGQSLVGLADELLTTFRTGLTDRGVARDVLEDPRLLHAFAQHHGVPTRLLDWSESPYVAAFFAYWYRFEHERDCRDEYFFVWVLDSSHPVWSGSWGAEIFSVPTNGNPRIRNQSGRFTLLRTHHDSLESFVRDAARAGIEVEGALTRLLLPASEATSALQDLDVMGVGFETLYPDVEGAARAALLRCAIRHQVLIRP